MILRGKPVAQGIAVGKIKLYNTDKIKVKALYCEPEETQEMLERLNNAIKKASAELDTISGFFKDDAEKGNIFLAQREILHDIEVYNVVAKGIIENNEMPDYAVKKAFAVFINTMRSSTSELFAARAADFEDVCERLVGILQGVKKNSLEQLEEPAIVVADDLLPSDTAMLDREKVLGIITEQGSITSHTAILANALHIPAILGVKDCMALLKDGENVILDATEGIVCVGFDDETKNSFMQKKAIFDQRAKEEKDFAYSSGRLYTTDGTLIELGLNVEKEKPNEAYDICDFAGLYRTEYLYMENDHFPTEEEQLVAYKNVLQLAEGKPVTLRTLDIGGDKTLSYAPLSQEQNPFLGKRAIRFCFAKPEILYTQIRAALRASVLGPLNIMFPMVNSVEDILQAKEIFSLAQKSLQLEEIAYDENVKFGIMIEVPSIVMMLDLVIPLVDFASVGTNDLCQYLCAADRMNAEVEDYYQMFSPAMLRALKEIADQFKKAGKPISVCGEMAGTSEGSIFLAGIGIYKLSMSAGRLPKVKSTLAAYSKQQLQQVAREALLCKTQVEVKATFEKFLRK